MQGKGVIFMNLAVVDDLEADLNQLKQLLTDYLDARHISHQIALFNQGEQFLSAFRPKRFDAVFLDQKMDGISGMELARCLRCQDSSIPIIFTTVEESYALEGYTVWAMDYIIKPISKERIRPVMDRLTASCKPRHIMEIKINRITRPVDVDDILYVRSVGHFLEIQMKKEMVKPYMTLDYFLSLLSQMGEYGESGQGLRSQNCCRGYVVCLDYVRSLETADFILSNGSKIPISRSKYKEMQAAYANYLFWRTRNTL